MKNRFLSAGKGQGPTAVNQMLLRAMAEHPDGELTVGALRSLSPFTENAQKIMDKAVVEVGLQRLVIAADMITQKLTTPLTDALSVTELAWNQESQIGGARRVMNPRSRGETGLSDLRQKRVPIYITMDDFSVGIRTMRMSERIGTPIDVSQIKSRTRRVNEAVEDSVINGAVTVDGYSTYGLLNAPNANTQALTAAAWTTAPVGSTVFAETELMINKLQADKKFGPYFMYVGTVISNALDSDYNATNNAQGLTIKKRLLQIESLAAIRTADMLPAQTVVLVQMTDDVIDMVDGFGPTIVPWTSADGFELFWVVMAIQVPRVRDDYDGNSGICIGSW